MNHKEQSACCERCRGEATFGAITIPACRNVTCPCHEPSVETTATEGEMVYEKAAPFHEPAQSVSQSPLPHTNKRKEWEEEFDRIFGPDSNHFKGQDGLALGITQWRELKSFIKEKIDLAHSEGFKEGVEKARDKVTDALADLGKLESQWELHRIINFARDALRDRLAQDISSKKE